MLPVGPPSSLHGALLTRSSIQSHRLVIMSASVEGFNMPTLSVERCGRRAERYRFRDNDHRGHRRNCAPIEHIP
jgi:hypothetical protein